MDGYTKLFESVQDLSLAETSDVAPGLLFVRTDTKSVRTLKLFVDSTGKAMMTLKKNRKTGVVEYRGVNPGMSIILKERDPEPMKLKLRNINTTANFWQMRYSGQAEFAKKIVARATRGLTKAELQSIVEKGHSPPTHLAVNRFRAMTNEKFAYAELPTKGKFLVDSKPSNQISRQVRLIFDKDVKDVMDSYSTYSWRMYPHLNLYNFFALNAASFQKVYGTSPLVAYYYLKKCVSSQTDDFVKPSVVKPSDIVRWVKKELDLPDDLWKVFAKLPSGSNSLMNIAFDYKRDMFTALRFIRDVNVPFPPPGMSEDRRIRMAEILSTAISNIGKLERYEKGTDYAHGDERELFVHIVVSFLKNPMPDNRYGYHGGVYAVLDALDGYVEENRQWGRTDLEGYRRRSNRWHLEQQYGSTRAEAEKDRDKNWESNLVEATINGWKFTSVTNGFDLVMLGGKMGNCLRTYVNRCVEGKYRVFDIQNVKDEGQYGAMSIRWNAFKDTHEWVVDQVEGSDYRKAPQSLREAALQIPALYNTHQSG